MRYNNPHLNRLSNTRDTTLLYSTIRKVLLIQADLSGNELLEIFLHSPLFSINLVMDNAESAFFRFTRTEQIRFEFYGAFTNKATTMALRISIRENASSIDKDFR